MAPKKCLLTNPLLFFLLFLLWVHQIEAQSSFDSQDAVANFRPSLAVVIAVLVIMFGLTFFLLLYAKCRKNRVEEVIHNDGRQIVSSSCRFSGIDKTVIDSLPFFRFSSLKGSKQGLECAVCLSKFEDVEILRLLPKCKHAFHIDCVDRWLEKHSSCPLCRNKVNAQDPSIFTYSSSTSMRFSRLNPEVQEDSNLEVFVQREQSLRGSSSRFSFTRPENEHVLLIRENENEEDEGELLHKFNHQIIVSDSVFKNRWSNVSSSDLIYLKSEMMNDISSNRFDSIGKVVNEEEMEKMKQHMNICCTSSLSADSSIMSSTERRSVSDITDLWRFDRRKRDSSLIRDGDVKEEKQRWIWLPIATRTVERFANRRETRLQQPSSQNHTKLDHLLPL